MAMVAFLVCLLAVPLWASHEDYRWRAGVVWDSLMHHYRNGGLTQRIGEPGRPDNWALGQVLVASLDEGDLTGKYHDFDALYKTLQTYRKVEGGYAAKTDDTHGVTDRYYDDNAWLGLAMVQAALQCPQRQRGFVSDAQDVYQFLQTGVRPDGGILWVENGDQYCFPSFGASAELGLHLYRLTGDGRYLDFARGLNDFVDKHFYLSTGPKAGLYADHFHPGQNDLNEDIWSYNQGTAIGMKVLLYRVSGQGIYLQQAQAIAAASMTWFSTGEKRDRLWQQPPIFNAVYGRNLLLLDAVAPSSLYRGFLTQYVQRVWSQAVDPDTFLLKSGVGLGYYGDAPGGIIDQAALTQLLAMLARPSSDVPTLTLRTTLPLNRDY